VESTTDILDRLIEEEQHIRERAKELGVRVEKEPPKKAKPFKAKKGLPRTELTDRELSKLFAETRDILDIYTIDYIVEHFDEAQSLLKSLQDKPLDPGTLVGSRIIQNIQELEERINTVKEQEAPTKEVETLLKDAKRVLDSLERYDSIQAKRKYADLLKRDAALTKGVDQPLELELEEYLLEIGKRIQRTDKKSSEDVGEELLEEIATLIGANTFDPDGYNAVAKKFKNTADSFPEELRLKIRDRLRECYAKMKDIEKKTETEKRVKEVRTKQFYWDSFAREVEELKADLNQATPGEFFRLYDTYNQLLDSLEHADLSDVSSVQIEQVKSLVDQCYTMLEKLRVRA
jgi:hypothetical protein